MSYNGTVRCGNCYERGHNQRSCPKLKARIAENPNGFEAQQAQRKAANATPRVCSYCQESGHNKRTCPTLVSDKRTTQKKNCVWREKFLNVAKKIGCAPGALIEAVKPNNSEYYAQRYDTFVKQNGTLAMVIGFDPSELNYELEDKDRYRYRQAHVRVLFPGSRKGCVTLPIEFEDVAVIEDRDVKWKMACPSDKDPRDCFGPSFIDGSDTVNSQLGLQG